jgi:hypothetical protein
MKPATNILIRLLLILAFATIAYGHVVIMASGALFDKFNREPYNLHTRWVSDFAAKWPEGIWIKIGIILFCIAVWLIYHAKVKSLPAGSSHSRESWFYHVVPLLLIGSLVFVLSFDAWSPRVEWKTRGIWPFDYREMVRSPKGPIDWKIDWYHRVGFGGFILSFFGAVGGGWMFRWQKRQYRAEPLDWIILIFAVASTVWLFTSVHPDSLPGIPQRFLLAAVLAWLWRETDMLNPEVSLPHRSDPPSAEGT